MKVKKYETVFEIGDIVTSSINPIDIGIIVKTKYHPYSNTFLHVHIFHSGAIKVFYTPDTIKLSGV